jgi:hypothetical protein
MLRTKALPPASPPKPPPYELPQPANSAAIPMCPSCGREAPIVYRGVVPYCTACGALRAPLSTPSINLAGKSAKVGGTVASVAGWLVLFVGLTIALGLGLLLWALFTGAIALAIAGPFGLLTAGIGALLLRGGSSLRQSGVDAERATRDQALLSMTAHHGPVTAVDAARLLNVNVATADAMLTALAKRDPERIAVDVDDQGVVWFRIARPFSDDSLAAGRVRVGAADASRDPLDELAEQEASGESGAGKTTDKGQVRR